MQGFCVGSDQASQSYRFSGEVLWYLVYLWWSIAARTHFSDIQLCSLWPRAPLFHTVLLDYGPSSCHCIALLWTRRQTYAYEDTDGTL